MSSFLLLNALLDALLFQVLLTITSLVAWFLFILLWVLFHAPHALAVRTPEQLRALLERNRGYRLLRCLSLGTLRIWLFPFTWMSAYHHWFAEQRVTQQAHAAGWISREVQDEQGRRVIEYFPSKQAMRDFDAQESEESSHATMD